MIHWNGLTINKQPEIGIRLLLCDEISHWIGFGYNEGPNGGFRCEEGIHNELPIDAFITHWSYLNLPKATEDA